MAELGLTSASRSRITRIDLTPVNELLTITRIILTGVDRPESSSDTPQLQADGTLVISGTDANL